MSQAARALPYAIGPGATFEPAGLPAGNTLALTGNFELLPSGVCAAPCEPDAYAMQHVVLVAGDETLSNGIVEFIPGRLVGAPLAFESLSDGSLQAGTFPVESTITETGTLVNDSHNHTHFQSFVEFSLGPLLFATSDPREVVYADPRGTWPVEVTLAYTLIERMGTSHSGWDGTGAISANEIVDESSQVRGYLTFTAHPIPEPGTGLLTMMGMLGLAVKCRFTR